MHGLWHWRLNIESQRKYQHYTCKWHTHESKFILAEHSRESSISIQGHQLQACSSLFLKAKVSTVCTCAYTVGWTLTPYLSHRPHPQMLEWQLQTLSNYEDGGQRSSHSHKMHFHDHHVCAHDPTVLHTALPFRFCLREKYFMKNIII